MNTDGSDVRRVTHRVGYDGAVSIEWEDNDAEQHADLYTLKTTGDQLVAAVAMAGRLYFSEVAHFTPCKMCWFQRIAMYPLAVLLLIADGVLGSWLMKHEGSRAFRALLGLLARGSVLFALLFCGVGLASLMGLADFAPLLFR